MRKVVSHADILSGKPHIVGTHITVAGVIGRLAKGMSIKQIAQQLPQLSEEDIVTAIKFAEDLTNRPVQSHE